MLRSLYGMAQFAKVRYGMVWYVMKWYGIVWYGKIWYGKIWYGTDRPEGTTATEGPGGALGKHRGSASPPPREFSALMEQSP